MGKDESGERGIGASQLSDRETVGMTHRFRVDFISLTEPARVVSGAGDALPTDAALEAAATSRRDGCDQDKGDSRDSQSHAAHVTVASASINTGRRLGSSQAVGRRSGTGLMNL